MARSSLTPIKIGMNLATCFKAIAHTIKILEPFLHLNVNVKTFIFLVALSAFKKKIFTLLTLNLNF